MNLVKWFRKNNTKIMAVVVIVLMVGFIGGSSLTYLLRGSGGMGATVARYGGKHKITAYDRMLARQELEMLQSLQVDRVLRAQNLRGLLLAELLFTHTQGAAPIMDAIRQTIQQGRYRVSEKQLRAMYDRTVPPDIYWLLLRNEAESAGFHIRSEDAGELLGTLIPQLFQGETYRTVMQAQMNRFGQSEANILAAFGKLLAVLQYAEAICSMESLTSAEIRHLAASEGETMDAEFVRIAAEFFADKDVTPPEAELQAQFEKYKDVAPGQVSETDPQGFGYKLPARLQLEYIALKLSDVSATVKPPTPQEMEEYYEQNRAGRFTEEVAANPADPNSPRVPRVRSYAEVRDTIRDELLRERIMRKAQQALLDARSLADAGLEASQAQGEQLSLAQLKEKAGKYPEIAQSVGQQLGLTLYSGRTGLLSAADIQQAKYLGRLTLMDYGYSPIRLSQVLFSVKELGDDAVTLITAPNAELYRSIGPAQDPTATTASDVSDQIMALVRIVDAKPAGPPESLDETFSTKTLELGESSEDEADGVYSVREAVVTDVRILAAWDTAKSKAAEFVVLASEKGWEPAVNEFNTLYGEQAKAEPNDPNVFDLDQLVGVQAISQHQLAALEAQTENNPSATVFVERLLGEQRFIHQLYALVPPDSNSLPQTPLVMEYPPDHSVYCLKSVSIDRLTQQRFQQMKGMLLRREEFTESQSLAVAHFTPKNILERMRFEFMEEAVQPAQDDTAPPPPAEDAL
jgi:hypothetical protein